MQLSVSDNDLLELVQKQTFRYFWDFAHPACGLARERDNEAYKDVITTGGSGFGLMCLVVAVERNWIDRKAFQNRLEKIIFFLENAETHQGAFSHWMNGNTGKTIPFSKGDRGADLVETSFLFQGLLTVRQYLKIDNVKEKDLRQRIQVLWENVRWNAFVRKGSNTLYWHWNKETKFSMKLKIQGYNEAMITYIMAASSPTYPISKTIYDTGWARNGDQRNGKSYYGTTLPLGPDYGGPLFFVQYGFLGLDPRALKDTYADYWNQNVAHCKINFDYCIDNPKNFKGYGENCWGLSACDSRRKYIEHSPLKDNGTICCSAAIASMPYLPEASLNTIKYFYGEMKEKLWGEYGFKESFNLTKNWFADSYVAINQGSTVAMLENYRTGLLWKTFMSCKEIQEGLKVLGFKL